MKVRLTRARQTESGVGAPGGHAPEAGFGFVETLIALVLLTFTVLGIAQMVVTGVYVSEASEDLTNVTALASQQMEALKATPYTDLTSGGSTTSNVTGYFDTLDMDGDGTGEFVRRWQVTDLGSKMQLDVIVLGPATATGQARQLQLTAQVVNK